MEITDAQRSGAVPDFMLRPLSFSSIFSLFVDCSRGFIVREIDKSLAKL